MDRAMDHLTDFDGWIPIRLYPTREGYEVNWVRLGATRFTEPFFHQSVQQLIGHPFHQAFRRQSSIEELVQWASTVPAIAPDGIVFHISRCGSTLVTQMLNAVPGCNTLSEPAPLDSALRMATSAAISPELKRDTVRALATAWGRAFRLSDCSDVPQSMVIKAEAWSLLDAALVREAWPDTPWVLLYRHPVEVVVSQLNDQAAYLIPGVMGINLTGLPTQQALGLRHDEHVTRSIGGLLSAMTLASQDPKAILVNYQELPSAILGRVTPHFGIAIAPQRQEDVNQVALTHAKHTGTVFTPDTDAKQRAASAQVVDWIHQLALPQYLELERLRASATKPAELLATL